MSEPAPETTPTAAPATTAPATPPASPQETSVINPDGTFREGWADNYAMKEKLARYASLDSLVEGYENAQTLISKRAISKPGESSTPEEIAAYRKAVGAPEGREGYIKPEWVDESVFAPFAEIADKHHMPAEAFNELFTLQERQTQDAIKAIEQDFNSRVKARNEALMHEYGADYERNMQLIEEYAKKNGMSADNDYDLAALTNPLIAKLLYEKAAEDVDGTLHNTPPTPGRNLAEQDRFRELLRKSNGNPSSLTDAEFSEYRKLQNSLAKQNK